MISKQKERQKAVKLRKKGYTYSEILSEVPVAKSTLSLWLRGVGLSKRQRQNISLIKIRASRKGGFARKKQRIEKTNEIKEKAQREIGNISPRELWLIGIALYWAEGTKEKAERPSATTIFSNTDPAMILLFKKWAQFFLNVGEGDIVYELYIHENGNIPGAISYWSKILGLTEDRMRLYYKKTPSQSKRSYFKEYRGLVRIKLKKSTDINRKISGWIDGITKECGIV